MLGMGSHRRTRDRTARRPELRAASNDGWTIEGLAAAPVGPGIRAASLEEAISALQQFDSGLPWKRASSLVVPLFQRIRPYPPGFPEPVRYLMPAGVSVTFGVDAGPAFIHVTAEIVAN